MEANTQSNLHYPPPGRSYTLPRNVSAIQVLPSNDGDRVRLGLITQLPEGAEVNSCGNGFNERTLKVQCDGNFYFVFLDDLEPSRKPVGSARTAHAS